MSNDDFGSTLEEMDTEAFLNMRKWLENALVANKAIVTGKGVGLGQADIDIEINRAPFNVSIRPLQMDCLNQQFQ